MRTQHSAWNKGRRVGAMLSQALRFLTPDNLRIVDRAVQELRQGGGTPAKSLVERSKSDEYKRLLLGSFKEGHTLAG